MPNPQEPSRGRRRGSTPDISERLVALGRELPPIPERLLLAHAHGEVLFIAGAGISQPAGLPDFRSLVVEVYKKLDPSVHETISSIPRSACNQWNANTAHLTYQQAAEVRRFEAGDYDVVLGMLERRMDGVADTPSSVRQIIAAVLRESHKPAALHRALMSLSNRGSATAIITTNFDRLLEKAAISSSPPVQTYVLGGIPRPSKRSDFSGILHIHGAVDPRPDRTSDFIVSDQDFGEFYLRRRTVADFVYDAARLFHLVMVGYSANDPPMRYLLNAIAADTSRFDDLKERFVFVGNGAPNPIALEDWRGRGITPLYYDSRDEHAALLRVLQRWAVLSAINGKMGAVEKELTRIVRETRANASEVDRDLFDHLVRRCNPSERVSLAALVSKRGADLGWLDALSRIAAEAERRRS